MAKHTPDRCSLGPTKGLEEKELLALSANEDLSFTYTPKPKPVQHVPFPEQEELAEAEPAHLSVDSLPLPPITLDSSSVSTERTLFIAGSRWGEMVSNPISWIHPLYSFIFVVEIFRSHNMFTTKQVEFTFFSIQACLILKKLGLVCCVLILKKLGSVCCMINSFFLVYNGSNEAWTYDFMLTTEIPYH